MPCTADTRACRSHGYEVWHKAHSYDRFAMVWHDGALYAALEPSGPCYGGPQNTDNRDYWVALSGREFMLSDALDGDRTAVDGVGASEWALAQVNAKAETADSKAENAQNTAQTADAKADAADNKAQHAQNAAETADAKADAAQEAAYAALEAVAAFSRYELCEFYTFRGPELPAGFYPRTGGVIADCASLHPEAWRKLLDTPEGRAMCLSEEAWQAMNKGTWATLADGSKVGWNGIGGVPFYAPDPATGALRLPDTRGMYAEDAGFDALGVGGTHGDGIRNIRGNLAQAGNRAAIQGQSGVFVDTGVGSTYAAAADSYLYAMPLNITLTTSRVVPTAAKNQPRAWGALACVYLGAPG